MEVCALLSAVLFDAVLLGGRQVVDLNVGELQMYGTVNWLNASDDLGKMKKGTELLTLLFIFKTGVVLMAQERIKGKRKPRVCLRDDGFSTV